jgi:putative transposase
LATGPNQLWSWDITRFLGPRKLMYFYLYVLLDVFSRYVVGWLLAKRESAALGKQLIEESCARQGILPKQLTVHSDRGAPMTSKTVGDLLEDLAVVKSLSRPRVSNDNPFSESQFKTMKYRPEFPGRFASQEHGLAFGRRFFPWYNEEHRHVGLGLFTPHDVHYGLADAKWEQRRRVLEEAFRRHPERFPRGMPEPPRPPREVWINPPTAVAAPNAEFPPSPEPGEIEIVAPGASLEVVSLVQLLEVRKPVLEDRCMAVAQ